MHAGSRELRFRILLNAEHPIYAAHFPGNPVMPGVCMIQMVKELVELYLRKELFLRQVISAKFLNVINPLKYKEVDFSMIFEDDEKVSVIVKDEDVTFARMSLRFD
jgi:3-hydroxyacyl-[acyl-carrier-protein] dehydratase